MVTSRHPRDTPPVWISRPRHEAAGAFRASAWASKDLPWRVGAEGVDASRGRQQGSQKGGKIWRSCSRNMGPGRPRLLVKFSGDFVLMFVCLTTVLLLLSINQMYESAVYQNEGRSIQAQYM
eukprot:295554-Amorphochlora_amoeboformis.AAC.1